MLDPESRWQLMKQKEVSWKRKRIRVAPLLPNLADRPSFILEVAMSVICEPSDLLVNNAIEMPPRFSLEICTYS